MSNKLQSVRGTRDIWGDEARLFREIDEKFSHTARLYDFQEIQTPIFEFTQVFKRSLGDETDIVNKEMYTFEDRSGDSLTLRPEGTASVARAVISNSMLRDLPLKLFYSGPMFRHERPQKGRYRQFTQFGVELIGVDKALADIEVLAFAWQFFKSCGLESKIQLEINTIGDSESRDRYRSALVQYFSKFESELSEDSQRRLKTNPLRILDSKDDQDKKFIEGAPSFENSLNQTSTDFFSEVINGISQIGIPFIKNERLVRGLDYYNHTVFEFTTNALGSQNAVLSGGRYDQLIETMGGPATPGVGWAAGTDRIALLLEKPESSHQTVAIIRATPEAETVALPLMQELRMAGVPAQCIYNGNMSKQMKKADKRGCSHSIVLGDEEIKSGKFTLKDLKGGQQKSLSKEELIKELQTFFQGTE